MTEKSSLELNAADAKVMPHIMLYILKVNTLNIYSLNKEWSMIIGHQNSDVGLNFKKECGRLVVVLIHTVRPLCWLGISLCTLGIICALGPNWVTL